MMAINGNGRVGVVAYCNGNGARARSEGKVEDGREAAHLQPFHDGQTNP